MLPAMFSPIDVSLELVPLAVVEQIDVRNDVSVIMHVDDNFALLAVIDGVRCVISHVEFHLPLVEAGRYDPRILNAFEFYIDYSLAAICIVGIVVITLWGLWIVKLSEELAADKQA